MAVLATIIVVGGFYFVPADQRDTSEKIGAMFWPFFLGGLVGGCMKLFGVKRFRWIMASTATLACLLTVAMHTRQDHERQEVHDAIVQVNELAEANANGKAAPTPSAGVLPESPIAQAVLKIRDRAAQLSHQVDGRIAAIAVLQIETVLQPASLASTSVIADSRVRMANYTKLQHAVKDDYVAYIHDVRALIDGVPLSQRAVILNGFDGAAARLTSALDQLLGVEDELTRDVIGILDFAEKNHARILLKDGHLLMATNTLAEDYNARIHAIQALVPREKAAQDQLIQIDRDARSKLAEAEKATR
ncbi:hypothetical protein KPL74_17260 [Bacillus sp. NP157]|nr:hypothetical protein KPL74_17260 [Bacillus sp. NP157]